MAGLVIQNGDIYEDELGPKYDSLRAYWKNPTPEGRRELLDAVSEEGFRAEFIGEVDDALVDRVPPDLWKLSWSLMMPQLRDIKVGLMDGLRENLDRFPRYQAYLRDLPSAELHLFDTGHWALETQLSKIVPVIGNFLDCVHR
ncbi:MAG: hydrolase [Mycobacterium sp.]|nr:hydrolase [Mycobacterium sp.]